MKLVPNYENREFTDHKPLEVLVTDLTYVRIGRHWDYACFSIVLSNREIIDLSISTRKEPSKASIYTLINLSRSDRGNTLIDKTFKLSRSLVH